MYILQFAFCNLHFAIWHLAFCYLAYKVLHSIFHINFLLGRGGRGGKGERTKVALYNNRLREKVAQYRLNSKLRG